MRKCGELAEGYFSGEKWNHVNGVGCDFSRARELQMARRLVGRVGYRRPGRARARGGNPTIYLAETIAF